MNLTAFVFLSVVVFAVLIIFAICLIAIKNYYNHFDDRFFYPDGKNGMIKVQKGRIWNWHANIESPRWQGSFLRDLECMRDVKLETWNKIVNHQPITQEEADLLQRNRERADKLYGTKEEILKGNGILEKAYRREKNEL